MGKMKLWYACVLPLLGLGVILLAGQTLLVNSAFASGVNLHRAEDLLNFLLKTEIPLLLIAALAVSAVQLFLIPGPSRPPGALSGFEQKLGELAAGRGSKNLYDQVLSLYRTAITDEQTGAVIYRHFRTMLESEFTRSGRYKMSFSLVKISVENRENFKSIFPKVAFAIANVLRNVDITSVDPERRFVILLPNTRKGNAETAVKRVWSRIRLVEEQTGGKIRLAAGISTFKDDGDTVELLLETLDRNLDKARLLGANMIVF